MKSVLIVGAGIAGLSAGIYARMNGLDAEIHELHNIPGGECTGWTRGQYHFDGAIHWLIGLDPKTPLNRLWRAVGAIDESTRLIHHDPFYSVEVDGTVVHFHRDVDRLKESLLAISPADAAPIAKLCRAIRALQSTLMPTAKPFDMMSFLDYVKLIVPMLPSAGVSGELNKTTVGQLAESFESLVLREAIRAYIPEQFTAFSLVASLASVASGDAGWPIGGSLALAQRMEKRFLELGGRIKYRSRVAEVITAGGAATGLRLSDGSELSADYVISSANLHHTLHNLLGGNHLSDELRAVFTDRQAYPLFSSVLVSLGIDADLSQRPHMLAIQRRPGVDAGGRINEMIGLRHYCYDPNLAPAGKSVLNTLLFADYDWWQTLKASGREAYDAEKKRIGAEIVALVEERYPETRGLIQVVDVATPMTYERYCNAWRGVWQTFAPTPGAKVKFLSGAIPGLDRFVLAGQWLMPPGGVPVAAVTGKWAIQRICRAERQPFKD